MLELVLKAEKTACGYNSTWICMSFSEQLHGCYGTDISALRQQSNCKVVIERTFTIIHDKDNSLLVCRYYDIKTFHCCYGNWVFSKLQ